MKSFILAFLFLCLEFVQSLKSGGCNFNGEYYKPDIKVEFGCFRFICEKGSSTNIKGDILDYYWKFVDINPKCPQCCVSNDPHFHTFDNHYYDFHGHCNYSISQPIGDCDVTSSFNPSYGIFGDFLDCPSIYPPFTTCLDTTTYKISDDLSVIINHSNLPSLVIGGISVTPTSSPVSYYNSFYSSVIVWRNNINCVYIVGNYYSMLACEGSVIIYTIPDHAKRISGLCGFFDYSSAISSEFIQRDCTSESNENLFGENWKTNNQQDKECLSWVINKVPECDKAQVEQICKDYIYRSAENNGVAYDNEKFSLVLENCIKDCCATGIDYCEKWADVGFILLRTLQILKEQTGIDRED